MLINSCQLQKYGVFKWTEERTYDGYWKEGKKDEKGKFTTVDGEIKFGV